MAEYDIALRGGRVVDGAGNPWVHADVGVRQGRIAAVGRIAPGQALREIDAAGLVVAPGFIDLHTHSDTTLLADGLAQSKVRQGVTLDIIGESSSVAPLRGAVLDEYRQAQWRRDNVEVDWATFQGYFARVQRQGIAMNVASCVAPQQVKLAVVGYEDRPATEAELGEMNALIAQAMSEGAVGLSTAWHGGGYQYPQEIVSMARVAARYGGFYGTHVGSEGFQLMEELEKAIHVGQEAGLPVHVYHLKIRGKSNWGRVKEAIAMIQAARDRGLDVTANQYPYTAMQHPWHRLFPRWVQDMAPSQAVARFRDPAFRARVLQDPEFQQYVEEHGGWEGIVGARFTNAALQELEGKTVAEVAAEQGGDPAEVCLDLVAEEGAFPFGVYHNMAEADVREVMRQPWVSIASDAGALNEAAPGKPHPRAFGTNPRVLGRYVREEGVLALEDAVRKMTSLPAQVLGLKDRGLLREGCWADIVAFDPTTVGDTATYQRPQQYPTGIPYVLVNGSLVIDRGQHTGQRPGQVVYGPGKGT
ncbi:MAG: D-aminoacylase [Chloroflexi bacterium]|nr:D-aminoacylase [Chloroflexota bacterium]